MTRAGRHGFTLLEVMIALAILSVGLVALSDVNGGAIQMHQYARRATEATLLLRGKMLDLEELLHKDGFSDYDDEKHGTFDEEGAPDYQWRAEILKPSVQLDADQLLGMLGVGGKGKGGSSSSSSQGGLAGALGGAAALLGGGGTGGPQAQSALAGGLGGAGPLAGLISGQAKAFIETLKKSVREVRLTVSWKDGNQERSISASQQIVILPESVGKAGAAQVVPGVPATTPGGQGLRARPPTLGTVNVSGDGDSQ